MLVGECKFKKSPFDKAEFENFLDKIKYIPVSNPQICIFSLSGFTKYVKENAGTCKLIGIDEMFD